MSVCFAYYLMSQNLSKYNKSYITIPILQHNIISLLDDLLGYCLTAFHPAGGGTAQLLSLLSLLP